MTNVPYNTNIPFASNSPSQDQPRMQENTNSLKSLIEIDHVGFGQTFGGYHTIIHQVPQSSVNTLAGINQLFTGVPGTLVVNGNPTPAIPNNGDTQLYSLTGQGGLSQLSGNSTATNTEGYQWIGGILIQWGRANISISLGSVNYTVPFPTNIFNLQLTLQIPGAGPAPAVTITRNYLEGNPVDLDKFFYRATTTGADVFANWLAIGN